MSSVRYCKPLFIEAGTFIKDLKLPQSSASRSNEQNVRGNDEVAMIEEEFTLRTEYLVSSLRSLIILTRCS